MSHTTTQAVKAVSLAQALSEAISALDWQEFDEGQASLTGRQACAIIDDICTSAWLPREQLPEPLRVIYTVAHEHAEAHGSGAGRIVRSNTLRRAIIKSLEGC